MNNSQRTSQTEEQQTRKTSSRLRVNVMFRRWHRRLGIVSAFFVVLISVTGILLNHTVTLGLAQSPLPSFFFKIFYPADVHAVMNFSIEENRLTQLSDGTLYYNDMKIDDCRGELVGVLRQGEIIMAGCQNELRLLSLSGEMVDRLDSVYGIPIPISRIGRCLDQPCFESGADSAFSTYALDIDSMTWESLPANGDVVSWSVPTTLSNVASDNLLFQHVGKGVNWERVLLDLHSGRVLGNAGVLLMDAMALLFIVLAVSGGVLWYSQRKRR